jgi:hypothetical protein
MSGTSLDLANFHGIFTQIGLNVVDDFSLTVRGIGNSKKAFLSSVTFFLNILDTFCFVPIYYPFLYHS